VAHGGKSGGPRQKAKEKLAGALFLFLKLKRADFFR